MPEAGAAICLVTYGGMAKWASFVLTFCSPTLLTHSLLVARQADSTDSSSSHFRYHHRDARGLVFRRGEVGKKFAEYPRAVSIF